MVLLSNAFIAFLLNIAAVFLVGAGSGLVLTLAGVFKDILLITGSVLIFGSSIAPLQIFGALRCHSISECIDRSLASARFALTGYSIALCGLILYKTAGSK